MRLKVPQEYGFNSITLNYVQGAGYILRKLCGYDFGVISAVLPKFTVSVELPSYVVTTDREMTGTVKAT